MSARRPIQCGVVALFVIACFVAALADGADDAAFAKGSRPNILLIVADDK